MKQKKDRIFVIIMGLVLANLVFFFAGATNALATAPNLWTVCWVFVDGIAIIGVLYLLRSYKRARRIEKAEETRATEEEHTDKDL